jgi:N-acetylmuramoyl-L-alanine amidase
MATFLGLKYHSHLDGNFSAESEWSSLYFARDQRKILLNGIAVWLHDPVQKARLRWSIAETDMNTVIDPILRSEYYLGNAGCKVIVLDPGHGGEDIGAEGPNRTQEKDVVLDIAKRLRSALVQEGYKCLLTREYDQFIELEKRAELAAQWKADLFVSIHANAAESGDASGVETYVLPAPGYVSTSSEQTERLEKTSFPGNDHDPVNNILGYQLHKNLLAGLSADDRGLRRARFVVLKNAPCPAVLCEVGFITNPAEEEKLAGKDYRESIARSLHKGVMDYMACVKRAQVTLVK